MLICWLIGHRYDYDIRKPEWLALVCTRCGKIVTLRETRIELSLSPRCTPSAPPREKDE